MTTMMSRTAFFSALITTIMMEGPSSVVRSTTSSLRDNDNDELSPFASRDLEAHHQSSEEEGSEERQRRRRGSPRNNSTNVASSQQIFYETHDGAFDDAVLHRAIADAGQWAYGIVMVEVWVLNRTQTSLSRAEKGWWIHPSFVAKYDEASSSNSSDGGRGDLLRRITDPSRADYIAPTPVAPGEGLPGALWSEARHHYNTVGAGRRRRRPSTWGRDSQHHASMVSSSSRRWSAIRASVTMAAATTSFSSGGANIPDSATVGLEAEAGEVPHEVVFRDLTQISTDPDQPYHPRLQALVELGLGYVAAVPIHQGLVLFLARKNVPLSRLQSLPNLQYLAAASRLIEASYHLRQPRIAAERARREEVQHAWRRLRTKVLALKRLGIDLAEEVRKHEVSTQPQLPGAADSAPEAEAKGSRWWTAPRRHQQGFDWTQERVRWTVRKARGGGGTPPPSAHWHQSIFIFVGVFVTLAAVTNYSVLLSRLSGSNRAVVPLGPFGAMVTLLYGLTMAPASQPRNALLGQALSLPIGLAFSYATALPVWCRLSLAPAFAVALTARLGVLHPPAGASAIILAGGGFGWDSVWATLVGTALAIVVATVFNNWSAERQYPMYWTGLDLESSAAVLWRRPRPAKPAPP